jgi:hypothetical protein
MLRFVGAVAAVVLLCCGETNQNGSATTFESDGSAVDPSAGGRGASAGGVMATGGRAASAGGARSGAGGAGTGASAGDSAPASVDAGVPVTDGSLFDADRSVADVSSADARGAEEAGADASATGDGACDPTPCLTPIERATPVYQAVGYFVGPCCVRATACGFAIASLRGGGGCVEVPEQFLHEPISIPPDDAGVVHIPNGAEIHVDPACPGMPWPWGEATMTGCCLPDGHCGMSNHSVPYQIEGNQAGCFDYPTLIQLGYAPPSPAAECSF